MVSWKTRNPEFRWNSARIFKSLFFVNFKVIEEFPKIFRSPMIFSEDDPRATEVSQIIDPPQTIELQKMLRWFSD